MSFYERKNSETPASKMAAIEQLECDFTKVQLGHYLLAL
jgi:hypothetical protein